ncbi:MAG: hypothetical protein K5644_10040 [Lachnospiraceae bacterium]|nr:hypothetical protein [Lachnospiraceae bacterium]
MRLYEEICKYIKSGETKCGTLGIEIEHFVVDDKGFPISFELMSETIKNVAEKFGFKLISSDGHVVGCSNEEYVITLEPSCQFEISINPVCEISRMETIYNEFYLTWEPEFIKLGYKFIAKAYLPLVEKGVITPDEIPLSPKKRYEYMDRYFEHTGKCGKYMMRASASAQVSIDYCCEEDLVRKFRLIQKISPILMILFENKYEEDTVLPGVIDRPHLFRTQQWDDLDPDRTGFFPHSFDDDFGYKSIADTIYNLPLILLTKDGDSVYVGDKSAKQLIEEGVIKEDEVADKTSLVEHFLSMGFYHLRVKTYIEIRMVDSLPIDRALGLVALIKGIMYNLDNMKTLEEELASIDSEDKIQAAVIDIEKAGRDASIYGKPLSEWRDRLVGLAKSGLNCDEAVYLDII